MQSVSPLVSIFFLSFLIHRHLLVRKPLTCDRRHHLSVHHRCSEYSSPPSPGRGEGKAIRKSQRGGGERGKEEEVMVGREVYSAISKVVVNMLHLWTRTWTRGLDKLVLTGQGANHRHNYTQASLLATAAFRHGLLTLSAHEVTRCIHACNTHVHRPACPPQRASRPAGLGTSLTSFNHTLNYI